MTILIAILLGFGIIGAIAYAAFLGSRRGLVLISLELLSFMVATVVALVAYQTVGAGIKAVAHVTAALSNVAGFAIIWVCAELACAVVIRFFVLPHIVRPTPLSLASRISGSVLNGLKTAAIITLALLVFSGLPLTPATKRPVTENFVARHFLALGSHLPVALPPGLGQDISDSFNFFTVTAEPESDERIELGYTTTEVNVDEAAEAAMLKLINRERANHDLPALTLNTKARAVARAYSTDMFARGYFSHLSPEGKTPFERLKAGGVKYGSAGENLALAPTLALAHDGLMKSPGHRANILSPDYRAVGIGIVDGGLYGLMVTQNFTD